MNKYIIFCIACMSISIVSCRNISEFNNEDAERNIWLTSFLQGNTIKEGSYNYTDETIEIYIIVDSVDIFYSKSDSIALSEGWKLNSFSPNFRVYCKEMKTAGNLSDVFILKMEYISPNILKVNSY